MPRRLALLLLDAAPAAACIAPSGTDGSAVRVAPLVPPESWGLVEAWLVDDVAGPLFTARLLELSSGRVIELPAGTFGWT